MKWIRSENANQNFHEVFSAARLLKHLLFLKQRISGKQKRPKLRNDQGFFLSVLFLFGTNKNPPAYFINWEARERKKRKNSHFRKELPSPITLKIKITDRGESVHVYFSPQLCPYRNYWCWGLWWVQLVILSKENFKTKEI